MSPYYQPSALGFLSPKIGIGRSSIINELCRRNEKGDYTHIAGRTGPGAPGRSGRGNLRDRRRHCSAAGGGGRSHQGGWTVAARRGVGHGGRPARSRAAQHPGAQGPQRRRAQLLRAGLRLPHHILNLCEGTGGAHGPAGRRPDRGQRAFPQQGRLRLRHPRHRAHGHASRAAVHPVRAQHPLWPNQHHHTLAAAMAGRAATGRVLPSQLLPHIRLRLLEGQRTPRIRHHRPGQRHRWLLHQ